MNSALSWDSSLVGGFHFRDQFWVNNVHSLNGKVYWGAQSLPVKVSFSDASGLACGAYVQSDSDLVFHQNWSPAESVQSSTRRELKAVCLALEAFASRLSDSKVIWYSDNQNVESILLIGSKKSDLQELALQAFHISLEYRISLDIKWIQRDLNETADSISKLIDFDDYALSDVTFQEINSFRSPHTVDSFACNYNAKLPRFNYQFFQLG